MYFGRSSAETIAAGALAEGTYTFTVFVSNGDVAPEERSVGNASATILVSLSAPPPVSMQEPDARISAQRTTSACGARNALAGRSTNP